MSDEGRDKVLERKYQIKRIDEDLILSCIDVTRKRKKLNMDSKNYNLKYS